LEGSSTMMLYTQRDLGRRGEEKRRKDREVEQMK
jgi:hypothetical protein